MGISSMRRYAVCVDRICLRTTRDGHPFMEIEGHYTNAGGAVRQIDVHLTDPESVATIREFYEKFGVEFHVNAYDVVLARWTSVHRRNDSLGVPRDAKIVFVGQAANAGAAPLKLRADGIRDFPPMTPASTGGAPSTPEKASVSAPEPADASPGYAPVSRILP